MDYVKGETLEAAWIYGHLSPEEKKQILRELATFVSELRSLQVPSDSLVASAALGNGLDYRVGASPFGPFRNHDEFHSFLRGGIPLDSCTEVYGEAVTRCHSRHYKSHFCHADLVPRNIIVRNGHIAAIIDWQFAGWYPEYWEYTKAHYGLLNMPEWYSMFQDAVPRYDAELAAERALWEQFQEPGTAAQWIDSFLHTLS